MGYGEGFFQSRRRRLYYRLWIPSDSSSIVLIVHGIGEHSARYENLARFLNNHNFGVSAFDLFGHGRSSGIRGHISRFDDYLIDLSEFMRFRDLSNSRLPIFLLGHSMGGLIALNFALKNGPRICGLVLSSPALELRVKPNPCQFMLAQILSRLAPFVTQDNRINTKNLSHDRDVSAAYEADALCHHRISARLYIEMLKAIDYADANIHRLAAPILLLQAGSDKILNPQAAERAFKKIEGQDKEFKVYPGLFHEIFNEKDNAQVLRDLVSWLAKHR